MDGWLPPVGPANQVVVVNAHSWIGRMWTVVWDRRGGEEDEQDGENTDGDGG